MTNVTLAIDEEVYKKMKSFSEIRWSEFVRKCVQQKIIQLKKSETDDWDALKFLGDEKLLAESWLSKEDEKAFAYLQ